MSAAPKALGDPHNFGRRVEARGDRIYKPRTLLWESLLLSPRSPLRAALSAAAVDAGLGPDAFSFLPTTRFSPSPPRGLEGEVGRVTLAPLGRLSVGRRRELARVTGRALALFAWLGLADLHWENLVLGQDAKGRLVFGPLDVEMILGDLAMPTETKLLPDADPEVAELCRHAAGVRRVLPWLGKPLDPRDLVATAAAYLATLDALEGASAAIARVFADLPDLRKAPIRVLLRGTGEYVRARTEPVWPPLLALESEQLARGDVPYFFRLYGDRRTYCFHDERLASVAALPLRGDVPRLEPLLSIERGLHAKGRASLREQGLFAVLGAFDHPSFEGMIEEDGLAVRFGARRLSARYRAGDELDVKRDLSAFVGSVYLDCRCGEARSVFVPPVTRCDAARR